MKLLLGCWFGTWTGMCAWFSNCFRANTPSLSLQRKKETLFYLSLTGPGVDLSNIEAFLYGISLASSIRFHSLDRKENFILMYRYSSVGVIQLNRGSFFFSLPIDIYCIFTIHEPEGWIFIYLFIFEMAKSMLKVHL